MMVVMVVKIVTRKSIVMATFNINPFTVLYIALERNLAIGVSDDSCNPCTVL